MASNNSIPEIPVIYYHSIGPVNKNWNRSFLTLELVYFEDQMKYFRDNYETLFLKDYWQIRNGLKSAEKDQIVITFDDGFLDNWIWAFPILKKYGLKATIFVCPEFVDLRSSVRPNLEDYWNKNASLNEITQLGYLNWEEMKIMLNSGLIDIQSHTMSHTKYFVSDKLVGFHHPGNDCLYPVGNLFPERKPYHILDPDFEKLIPYGYPLFQENSSVCARKVTIDPQFIEETTNALAGYDFGHYSFSAAQAHVKNIYQKYTRNNGLITNIESEEEYLARLDYEITGSKKTIEIQLNNKVEFLCWPHGDNNETSHRVAREAGFLATTSGSNTKMLEHSDRIPSRIGLNQVANNRILSLLKTRYKTGSALNHFPYSQINAFYNVIRYGKLKQ